MKQRSLRPVLQSPPGILILLILGVALGIVSGCSEETPGEARIVFASGPDDTGTVQRLVEDFNTEHAGRIQVTWKPMDRNNNAHRQQLVTDFTTEGNVSHVIAGDVIWTAEFANNAWVDDLTDRFYEDYDRGAFLAPALDSATFRLRIWGVPWYSDASVLFYRKDLLAASGFDAPPQTWDELIWMSQQIMTGTGTRHGFVFQGAEYEGGTANAVEYIWGAGGEVIREKLRVTTPMGTSVTESDAVTINSGEAAAGLDAARRLISEGVTPVEVTTYREQESLEAFIAGDAVFLRSWPYVQGVLTESPLASAQVGVSWLPGASQELVGYSCLGGWNLMISANISAAEKAAAWEFIRYLTSPTQQKRQALEAGLLPVIESLYADAEILGAVPVAALARDSMSTRVRARPLSPFYAEMSADIASAFKRVLEGQITGAQAVAELEGELRATVTRNR